MPLRAGALAGRGAWIARGLLAAGFFLLILSVIGVGLAADRSSRSDAWIAHTIEVRHLVQRTESALMDMEAGARGFLLTGQGRYLDRAREGQAAMPKVQEALRSLTADNPEQQRRLDQIDLLIAARTRLIADLISLAESGRRTAALRRFRDSDATAELDAIRAITSRLDADELQLFQRRQDIARRDWALFLSSVGLALSISLALGVGVFFAVGRYVRSLEEGTVALRNEIDARERAEGHLRQAQKMDALGRLTGGIAHDFNNMLAIVIGSLDLLQRRLDPDGDPKIRSLAANAFEGAQRAGTLTQRLLAFSRQQPLEPRPIDANKIVADLGEVLGRTLGGGVRVETVLAGGLWRAFADPPQLESAILNLAVNARDAMGEGGKITIETANTYLDQAYAAANDEVEAGQYVMVAVTDVGPGMAPEILANAFEPFFTTKERGAGTGLGLSQVHGFVKQSGGHVKIYTEFGHGTTVKLYLPRFTGEEQPEDVVLPPQAMPIACTVLVAEDESGVRAFVAEALRVLGCRVVEAENAADALAKLDAHPAISLLLTDVIMPGENGRVLAGKALERRPDLKVIYMTGYTRNAIVHNGMVDPGTNLLTKPFTVTELELELKAVLGR